MFSTKMSRGEDRSTIRPVVMQQKLAESEEQPVPEQDTTRDAERLDMILKRPRTPNDQYTCMTEQQIRNVRRRSRANPVFYKPRPLKPDRRYLVDRCGTLTSQYQVRGQPGSNPYCWLDFPWRKDPPEEHDTSRLGASLPWGPERQGCRAFSHYDGEDVFRYLTIDTLCRPPTNHVGQVTSKFGRASGYYLHRKPNCRTWCGSSHQLNNTDVLREIRPQDTEEYRARWEAERQRLLQRRHQWPSYSEYSDRYTLHTGFPAPLNTLERKKQHVAKRWQGEDLTAVYGQRAIHDRPCREDTRTGGLLSDQFQ